MFEFPHEHLHIEFFTEPVQSKARSAQEGRPIFEDQEFVRIRFRGDKNRIHVAPAHDRHARHPETNEWLTYAQSFPRHYEAFKEGQEFIGEGTPLSELPFLTEAKRAELRALNIHTAEALAGLDGTPLQRLGMGGRALKNQAEAWLARARDSALETRLAAENADLREQMKLMQQQIADMQAGTAAKAQQQGETVSPFADWEDADIKAFIADRTGTKPKGNPGHATLVAMADDVIAKEKAEAEAA